MLADLSVVGNAQILRYESLVKGDVCLDQVVSKLTGLNVEGTGAEFHQGLNDKYFATWSQGLFHLDVAWWKRLPKRMRNLIEIERVARKYEERVQKLGYSLRVLSK
jgi:hypothetical protein